MDLSLAPDSQDLAEIGDPLVGSRFPENLLDGRGKWHAGFKAPTATLFPGLALYPADFAKPIAVRQRLMSV
jgi:hypothetical protein